MAKPVASNTAHSKSLIPSISATGAWIESNHMIETCLWNPDKDGII
jgi:hypothetical protein